ncbi:MAG: DoxX family protein [Thermoanaerobaculia bacterium]
MHRILGRYAEITYALLRIVAGFTFSLHGAQKLLGAFGGVGGGGESVQIASRMGLAGAIELVCGVCILVGLLGSWAAFLASGEMAAAYFMAHAPQGFWPIANGGELAVVYAFVFLHIATRGSGAFSLDRLLGIEGKKVTRLDAGAGP